MNTTKSKGWLPQAKPVLDFSNFVEESNIAVSFAGDNMKTTIDFTVADSWKEQ